MSDCLFDKFDEEFNGDVIKTISNGETSMIIRRLDNGDVVDEDKNYIGNIEDDDIEDKIDEYAEEWHEVNWNTSDWADHYGCDESEVEDYMMDDFGGD